ncbi:UDP-N-acetylmuramoyl-L-alanine--D-glutamate ligase [Candidatus Saccharibacteria bacterium]|nr:UDP-N-acetylmuramoyl-L-alanine--D-glutamate ligase [Candidatus Saccharibacteria bacterium]MCL1962776.1 UDP-N-acetylmuramoyl-L-alanine--D-glutamate ligase [Candidatus Saccharibacteria bacterium]
MKIAIVGFAREGKSNLEYFGCKFPEADFTIFDERSEIGDVPVGVDTVLGADAFDKIQDFDLVLRSAGVAPYKIAQKTGIWSSTREFFAECPALIIGVTGTKGKGTTCTMIRDILRADGKNAFLVGNIGVPALDQLPNIKKDDIVVFELSSFQLWDLEQSPSVAAVLRIEADHLDVHGDFANYVDAKANIAKHQSANDKVVYYENNAESRQIAELSPGRKIAYPGNIEFDTSVLQVPGMHYVEDAEAAIAAVSDIIDDTDSIAKGLGAFRAMPHRLELVRELNGVKYYDDNFSASFPSLDVAVRAFPNNDIILIAGGKDRGLNNYRDIANAINNSTVKQIFLIGETAPKIAEDLYIEHKICSELAEAVINAHAISRSGDIVLMSPGAPSFDMFESFEDRGKKFQELVRSLK